MLRLKFQSSPSRPRLKTSLQLRWPNLAAAETLKIASFRYLWGSHALTNLANQIRVLVIAWLVLDLTGSQLWVGLANGLPAIAVAAFSLGGGVLVDRISPRSVLFRVRLTMAVAALITAALVSTGMIQLWHILLLTLLMGGVNAIEIVAARVCLSALVCKEQLLNALSLTTMVRNLAVILGPSVAGMLLARAGTAPVLWVLASIFFLAVVALGKLPVQERSGDTPKSAGRDLLEGFLYSCRTPPVRWLMILGAVSILGSSFFPLVPVHARDTLGTGPDGLGFLMGAYGAGGLIGSALLVMQGNIRRKGLVLGGVAIIWGLALVGLGFSRELYLSLGCLFAIGLALSIWINNLYALLQTTVEPWMRGRVVSLNKVLMQQPMFWLVGGVVASVLGHLGTLLLGAGIFVIVHLVAYWRTPQLRQAQ